MQDRRRDPRPIRSPATIPMGSVTPSATPAIAPTVTIHRPRNRIGRLMCGEAITTMAVAIARRIARYTGGCVRCPEPFRLEGQSVPATSPATRDRARARGRPPPVPSGTAVCALARRARRATGGRPTRTAGRNEISQNHPKSPGSSDTRSETVPSTAVGPGAKNDRTTTPSNETISRTTSVGRRARGASLADEKMRTSTWRSARGSSLARRPPSVMRFGRSAPRRRLRRSHLPPSAPRWRRLAVGRPPVHRRRVELRRKSTCEEDAHEREVPDVDGRTRWRRRA